MYRRKAFLDHHPIIMIVSRYTLDRKSSTKKTGSEWVGDKFFLRETETFLSKGDCAWPQRFGCNLGLYSCLVVFLPHYVHRDVLCQTWVRIQSCDDIYLYLHQAEVLPCNPLGHCGVIEPIFMCPECRGHFYPPDVGIRCCAVACAVSYRILCPPYTGCVFTYAPLWGS